MLAACPFNIIWALRARLGGTLPNRLIQINTSSQSSVVWGWGRKGFDRIYRVWVGVKLMIIPSTGITSGEKGSRRVSERIRRYLKVTATPACAGIWIRCIINTLDPYNSPAAHYPPNNVL